MYFHKKKGNICTVFAFLIRLMFQQDSLLSGIYFMQVLNLFSSPSLYFYYSDSRNYSKLPLHPVTLIMPALVNVRPCDIKHECLVILNLILLSDNEVFASSRDSSELQFCKT